MKQDDYNKRSHVRTFLRTNARPSTLVELYESASPEHHDIIEEVYFAITGNYIAER